MLKVTAGDTTNPTFIQGREYLHILLQQLSRIRGKESRYLQPLISKMDSSILDYEVPPSLPLPSMPIPGFGRRMSEQFYSMVQPSLKVPNLPLLGPEGRRMSGMVFSEDESRVLGLEHYGTVAGLVCH